MVGHHTLRRNIRMGYALPWVTIDWTWDIHSHQQLLKIFRKTESHESRRPGTVATRAINTVESGL